MKRSSKDHRIAIVGLGCRYPGADGPVPFWENVLARRSGFRRIPDCRLPLADYYDPDPKTPDKTYSGRAAVIDGFDFNWQARRVPHSTYRATDIAHWLALDTALQAVDHAGMSTETLDKERTGVIVGNSLTGEQWRASIMRMRWPVISRSIYAAADAINVPRNDALDALVDSAEQHFKSIFPPVDEDTLAGYLSNTIAGRICGYLDLKGGGYVVDGACASSLLAVVTAAQRLAAGDLDVMIAGGVDVSLDTFELIGFAKAGALSSDLARVYDSNAAGFLPGEGCGFVVLKRLADARRDKNHVIAVLHGWGISSDGNAGITAPTVRGQALALQRAYEIAGYSPHTLDFIEGHGTGTPLGDKTELSAIAAAMHSFGEPPHRSCGVTSLKSLVGHTKAAAGVGGLIKAALGVYHRVLPPTNNCHEPNAVFLDTARALYPITQGKTSEKKTLRAAVSAMGFGGINSHITLESADAPIEAMKPALDERALISSNQQSEVFLISSTTASGLRDRVTQLCKMANGISEAELVDLSATLSGELQTGSHRAAIVASNVDQLLMHADALVSDLARTDKTTTRSSPCRRRWVGGPAVPTTPIAFVFPGQGAQQLNAGRRLVDRFDWARNLVQQADEWLVASGLEPISDLLFVDGDRLIDRDEKKASTALLTRTQVAQPAICLASTLWLCYLRRIGVAPERVAGHSLGELSALHAAGALDAQSLIKLAGLRGAAMAKAGAESDGTGAMASLRCERRTAEQLLAELNNGVVLANINTPKQMIISGEQHAVTDVVRAAEQRNIACRLLTVSEAFHSPRMATAEQHLRELATDIQRRAAVSLPMLSTDSGKQILGELDLLDYVCRQICAPVDFLSVASQLTGNWVVEVGPGRVLSGLLAASEQASEMEIHCVESEATVSDDFNTLVAALHARGIPLQTDQLYHRRLVKPFVPAADRSFIDNPCERPFRVEHQPQTKFAPSIGGTFAAPDIEAETLAAYLSERSEFLTDVIRADLKRNPLSETLRTKGGSQTTPGRSSSAETSTGTKEAGAEMRATNPSHSSDTRDIVRQLIAQKTGFPSDSLDPQLKLLDDLRLDSIKATELIATAAKAVGVAGELAVDEFFNASIDELANALETARSGQSAAGRTSTPDVDPGGISARYPRWIREFVVEWHDEERPSPNTWTSGGNNSERTASVLFVATSAQGEKIADAVSNQGALVDQCSKTTDQPPTRTYSDYVFCLDLERDSSIEGLVNHLCHFARFLPRSSDNKPTVSWLILGDSRCVAGFAASVHHERAGMKTRVVTINGTPSSAEVADIIRCERFGTQLYRRVRYERDGTRQIPRIAKCEPVLYPKRVSEIGTDDVVLITGGAKGITAECALALGKASGAQLILTGRSAAHVVQDTLSRLADEGVRAVYRSCDVTDATRVTQLITELRHRFGPITVVIHGAGQNRPERLTQPDSKRVLQEIGPKLLGGLNLLHALQDAPPKIVAALTSIIGITGMPGNAWYALANECLASELADYAERHHNTSALALAYSVWEDVGMGANLQVVDSLARDGIDAISVRDGVARFQHLLQHQTPATEVAICGRLGGLDTWPIAPIPYPPAGGQLSFLEDIVSWTPHVELVSRIQLTRREHPYLDDHYFQGSYLFPTVFGLEAMAQAVSTVTGRASLRPLSLECVTLTRPLVVDANDGLLIEIAARVQQLDTADSALRIEASIRSEQSGFKHDHFGATFILATPDSRKIRTDQLAQASSHTTTRNLMPDALYGPMLFQGPRFQRIESVAAADDTVIFTARRDDQQGGWLLGDPYFRDALLQSAQICVHPQICLPVRVQRWQISACVASTETHMCRTVVTKSSKDSFRSEVHALTRNGRVLEHLEGYETRVVGNMSAGEPIASISTPTGLQSDDIDPFRLIPKG